MGEVAAVFVAFYAAHQVADHWVQSSHQAARKGLPGWVGRWNCAKHVATYHLTVAAALFALAAATGWRPHGWSVAVGLVISAVTHYVADRRRPLHRLAEVLNRGEFLRLGVDPGKPSLGTGAYALDQSWHIGWIFVSALVVAI